MLYLNLCANCPLKQHRVRKSLVINPIREKNYNFRMQADLIDLQTNQDGPFKYILNMQVLFVLR